MAQAPAVFCVCFGGVCLMLGLFPPGLSHVAPNGPFRTVLDPSGKPVAIASPYGGSAFFAPFLQEYLLVSQETGSVVAMSASDFRYINHEDSLLAKIYPGLLHLNESISRRFSPAGNLEAMLQLRPGAIFAYSLSYAEPLRRLGLPVISFPIIRGKIPQSDYYRHALQYERVLGITGRADELWKRFQAGFARLKAELGDVTVRPRVMLALTKQPDNSFQVVGGGELLGDFLYLAGGRALDNAGRAFLNPEQVMMQNPDVILLLSLTELSPADFYSDPRFASLSAVRSRRVYKVPTGILDSQTFPNNIVESPLFCEWLAELIHPEVMPRDLRPVIRSTYAAVFGYTISNPELDRILSLNANAASMGYRRFEQ